MFYNNHIQQKEKCYCLQTPNIFLSIFSSVDLYSIETKINSIFVSGRDKLVVYLECDGKVGGKHI